LFLPDRHTNERRFEYLAKQKLRVIAEIVEDQHRLLKESGNQVIDPRHTFFALEDSSASQEELTR